MKKAAHAIAIVVFVLGVITAAVAVTLYEFEIYKKKHGDHMTFIDFVFDSERK